MRLSRLVRVVISVAITTLPLLAQSPNGNINGLVSDPATGEIVGAEIIAVNDVTGLQFTTKTNSEGIYVLPNLPPGPYRLQVSKVGFKTIIKPDIVLNVQDALSVNFTLPIGALHEIVTVEGGAPLVNTESPAVSTVVDRQFAENLPMNGRSFQTLIELTPGVVSTPSTANDGGQFSVNGQRASSNYWMVDGVSANIGIGSGAGGGNGFGGALGSFSAMGGTNSLVSVDALQEFRIQTSTYAPEFGRTPGAQISILTRSGTSQFHGTAFDYLRNDVLDANDWFAANAGLRKPQERQNDFGGTLSGPIVRDRTFFFLSYEGLRLRLPQVAVTTVPCDHSCKVAGDVRTMAASALQPYLKAYPVPNGPEVFDSQGNPTSTAEFNSSYSDPSTLDAYSLRIDHRLSEKLNLFGHYDFSPSEVRGRPANGESLSVVRPTEINTQYGTAGTTWAISTRIANDLRLNYSNTNASASYYIDSFGGATPLKSVPSPSSVNSEDARIVFDIFSLRNGSVLQQGKLAGNHQSQVNLVDNLSYQLNNHSLKFGIDFRRLAPVIGPLAYGQEAFFSNVPSAEAGNLSFSEVLSQRNIAMIFKNLGLFAQDTWRVTARLTLTYGLRWDVDFTPFSNAGPNLPGVTGFNLNNLANLALAPIGTSPFRTTYGNIAPRVGAAYRLSQNPSWQTSLRGGFGIFYDLVTSNAGNDFNASEYPFGAVAFSSGGTFPLDAIAAAPPPITPPSATNSQSLFAFDPHIRLPYSLQWNFAVEQELGKQQTISASYIGSAGRRLLQTTIVHSPNPNLAQANLITNLGTSDYNAFQLQFQRRLSRGLQLLASYTWAHSIDDASAGSYANASNLATSAANPRANRGASDFDIRHAFSLGMTYDVPAPNTNRFANALLSDWSLQSIIQARSSPPLDVFDASFAQLNNGVEAAIRPDFVPGQSPYLLGNQCAAVFEPLGLPCAGGKGLNPAAFMDPPFDPITFAALRQGNVPRNFLRGFGTTQWDFAVHREFPIRESLKLQFRAEMFNALNHPNFGPPNGAFVSPQFGGPAGFGVSTQTQAQFLNGGSSGLGNVGSGALSPLYQIGGPRSIQFGLKLAF